jgi:hypothetical protein
MSLATLSPLLIILYFEPPSLTVAIYLPTADHYICLDVKRLLIQLYGWRKGFGLGEMSIEQLERKLELCRNYIQVYSKVEPSPYTKWRGRLLEEMVGPMAMIGKRKYARQEDL